MKKIVKQEKNILISFFFLVIVCLWFIIAFFSYFLPKINEINLIKTETKNIYNDVNRIKKSWMNYNEFISIVPNVYSDILANEEENKYFKEVINNIEEDFYNKSLINTEDLDYQAFLDKYKEDLKSSSPLEEKNEIISQLLPIYSELVYDLWDNTLSDYKFINYIESIIETFSLTYNNPIWIDEILIVEDYSVWELDNLLETNIYYIPLNLNISWRRQDILDFLYFINNVWTLLVDWENNSISLNKILSRDFSDSFRMKVLKGQTYTPNYNIFNNQVIDVQEIIFNDYIDPSINFSNRYKDSTSLVNYIKTSSFWADDNMNMSVDLRFYIKGLPIYKIENYINNFISDFRNLSRDIINHLWNKNLTSVDRQKLIEIQNILWQYERSILLEINENMKSKETMNDAYKIVNMQYPILENYKNTLNQIKK